MFEPIRFKELKNLDDCSTLTIVGADISADEETLKLLDEKFHEWHLIAEEKHVIDIRFITGNVKGEDGREDFLVVMDHPELMPNCMVRLSLSAAGVKWTSDFVDNYKRDYKSR